MKLGCVIQGDLRVPLTPILRGIESNFAVTVVSTWVDQKTKYPPGNYDLILNEPPEVVGITNRNLQRFSTARGLDFLEEQGCTHILKWRTDMLPTKLNVENLLKLSLIDNSNDIDGRIVTGGFRHLSVAPDWFSSFPDLYSFSSIKAAKLLWSDEGFEYQNTYNIPAQMRVDLQIEEISKDHFIFLGDKYYPSGIYAYDAHTELYAIFKDRLQKIIESKISHPEIVKKYFHLIPDDLLGICWYGSTSKYKFRPIKQGYHLKWWKAGNENKCVTYDFSVLQKSPYKNLFYKLLLAVPVRFELIKQYINFLKLFVKNEYK
jgi:hypothetical protein